MQLPNPGTTFRVYSKKSLNIKNDNERRGMIHNHPSGDPTPSEADLSMTKEIQKGCKYLGLTLHDHIIVGAGIELSLRALGKL